MNQSSHLYQLQKLDSEIDHHQTRIREIDESISNNQEVKVAEENQNLSQKALHQAQNRLRNIEDEANSTQLKIQTCESNLYSGRIRNPKELQDLQVEITSLKRRFTTLEDEQLEAMMTQEELEKNFQQASEVLHNTKNKFLSESAILLGEKNSLLRSLERLQSERSAIAGSILPENLSIYEKLYKTKRGIAVVTINDSSCSSCGAGLRPSEIQNAHSPQQITYCSYCGRILYAG